MNEGTFSLSNLERQALETLCAETFSTKHAVDTVTFRAEHRSFRPVLRRLHTLRYINEENSSQTYTLTVLGLREAGTPECKRLLDLSARLLDTFRDHYQKRETRKAPLLIRDLSERLCIDRAELNFSLTMLESLTSFVLNGRSLTFEGDDAFVRVDERIYDYESVNSIIAAYEGFRNQALLPSTPSALFDDRQHLGASSLAAFTDELVAALPDPFRPLAREVDVAFQGNLSCLPVMGLRALLDMYCSDIVGGDTGGFSQKIERIRQQDLLHEREIKLLEAALEVAHAAAHRMHSPKPEECRKVLGITVHLLGERYLLSPNAQSLRDSAPPRNREK